MAPVNITSIKTASSGLWQGDNPLNFAFPLLILQTTLIMVVSRVLGFLLKPLRQPKVIAEIAGGILLGPSAFGRNKEYMHKIFPKWSSPILETIASIGLLFFLFLVGIELDLSSIRRRSGKSAFCIALAGVSLPFLCGIGVAIVLRKTIDGADKVGFGQFVVFMGVSLSITAFPVLARILAELKLLTTRVGETAMAAAALNDVAAWILLAIAVALAGDDGVGGHKKSPLVSVWVLLSGIAFVAFMMVVIQPAMNWVARRSSPEQDTVDEAYICLTLTGVMVAGFVTDLIGIHSIFGAFVFGLTIPKGGQFADKLILRIEDFVSGLLLPLYFASSGLKTDVAKISGGEAWGLLALVTSTACAGKILGTSAVAMLFMIPAREAMTLGVLMNTKGLVELIVLNIGKEKKVLNDETFAILVLMAVFTTFITSPLVMAIYKPARGISVRNHRKLRDLSTTESFTDDLRVLACVHGPANVPSLIGLIESIRSTKKAHLLKLFILHLLELTERSSSIIMVRRARKNGFPFFHRLGRAYRHDSFVRAFQGYSELGRVSVRPTTAISAMSTMHEDICHVAEEKRVVMIILPFHKQWRREGEDRQFTEIVENAWRGVNQKVLQQAPCSVAILVDRGFGNIEAQHPSLPSAMTQRICMVFFGGPDDREALELGSKMAQHQAVKVTIVRFVEKEGLENDGPHELMLGKFPSPTKPTDNTYTFSTAKMDREKEKELDEGAIAEFRSKWDGKAEYTEKVAANNIVEGVLAIGRSGDHDLLVVGKGRFPSSMVAEFIDRQAEHAELGPIGDTLACSGHGVVSSVLVIQQHDVAHAVEAPVSKIVQCNYARSISDESSSNVAEISKEPV